MVSVVITAYNVGDYLEKSIKSAIQDGVKEITVVVDQPTDNSLEIAQTVQGEYPDLVKIIRNAKNVGPGLSRRYGIEASSGEYILLLDGDDYLDENYVKPLLDRAIETNADIVSSGIKIINEDGSWKAESYGNCTTLGNDKISRFWGERIVFINNKLVRRNLYAKVPYSHRRYIEDTPTIIPILWYANKVEYVDMLGYNYVMRNSSLTHTTNPLKDVIYKGLCWLDLMEFFTKNDQTVFSALDIKGYIRNIINILNRLTNLTPATVEPYKEDWIEFTLRMTNLLAVTAIDFKQAEQ